MGKIRPGRRWAFGLLAAPVTVDRARAHLGQLVEVDASALGADWDELERDARRTITDQDIEVAAVRRTADLRYRGQAFELEVTGSTDADELAARFHRAHRERYGYDQPEAPIEVITLRVRAEGPAPTLPLPPLLGGGGPDAARLGTRGVVAADGEVVRADLLDRSLLGSGARLRGPAVVIGLDATVWVAPWQVGEVDPRGVLVLEEAR